MHTLTPDTLEEGRLRDSADHETYKRAQALFQSGHVQVGKVTERTATSTVHDRRNYRVELKIANNYLYLKCNCLHAGRGLVCEHELAACFGVRAYLQQNQPPEWKNQLDSLVREMRLGATAENNRPYLLYFSLQQVPYTTNWRLVPYQLAEHALPKEIRGSNLPDKPEIIQQIITENKLTRRLTTPYQALDPFACLNCPPENVALANLIQERANFHRSFHAHFPLDEFLSLLANTGTTIFLGDEDDPLQKVLYLLSGRGRLALYLERNQDGIIIKPSLSLDDNNHTLLKGTAKIIHSDQVWALVDHYLCPVGNPAWIATLNNFRSNN
jgi:hypothetical protein